MPSSQNGDPGSSGVWQEEECHRYGTLSRAKKTNRPISDDTAAVARCVQGKGLIRVNGKPLKLFAPEILRAKLYEPVLLLGTDKFAEVDIRVRVAGGGHTSQVYATRQAVRFHDQVTQWHNNSGVQIDANTQVLNRLPRPLLVPRTRCDSDLQPARTRY